jgi:sugar lactone lactonase YvrE
MSISRTENKGFSNWTKFWMVLIVFCVIAGSYFTFRVFGSTVRNATLATQSATENGLHLHWSFDGDAVGTSNSVNGWDAGNAAADGNTKDVSAQGTNPRGIAFSADGTKMYHSDSTGAKIYQYSLSAPWDVSTASYDSVSLDVSSQSSGPGGFVFSSDGTKIYMFAGSSGTIYEYSLSSAWDLSTATYASKSKDVSAQTSVMNAIAFASDGTSFVMAASGTTYMYTLGTAWDISTASFASKTLDNSGEDLVPWGIAFNNDGTKFFLVGSFNETLYEYTLATPWDVSTAVLDGTTFSVSASAPIVHGLTFSSDGTKFYIVSDGNNTIVEYTDGSSSQSSVTTDSSGNGHNGAMSFPSFINKQTFSSVGTTTFSVPSDITSITIKAWGAGGGSAGSGSASGSNGAAGGGGGFAEDTVTVTPGASLSVLVGGGGVGGAVSGCVQASGGGGGGYSGVHDASYSYYVIAPGGGGGGSGSDSSSEDGGPGGAGGGATGTNGTDGQAGFSAAGTGGGGGTPTSGGAGGSGGGTGGDASDGASNMGGTGGQNGTTCAGGAGGTIGGGTGGGADSTKGGGGGGGGGGYYGGGGGEAGADSTIELPAGGGGGGSAYVTGTNTIVTAGSDTTAANNSDSDYVSGTGNGADTVTARHAAGSTGNDGLVVFTYASLSQTNLATSTAGRIGQALYFGGNGQYVSGGDIDDGTKMKTFAFWMKAATTTANQSLMNVDFSDGTYISTDGSSNITATGFSSPTIYVDGSSASAKISDTNWHFVTIVTDSTGVDVDDFAIGSTTGSIKPFGGSMDDVRVYDRQLSQDDVTRLYKLGGTTKINQTLDTQPTLDSGLVGWWTFDGKDIASTTSTRTAIDRSGTGYTGTVTGNIPAAAGRIGQALSFPGGSALVALGNITQAYQTQRLSISLWIYDSSGASAHSLVSRYGGWAFFTSDASGNDIEFAPGSADNYGKTTGGAHHTNEWEHWVMVYDGTQSGNTNVLKMYRNGVQQTLTYSGTVESVTDNHNNSVTIGNDPDGCCGFVGLMDDVRIYNRALSQDDITRLYKLGGSTKINTSLVMQPALNSGLVGHWTFDGKDIASTTSTRTAIDSSGNSNTGTMIGNAGTAIGKIGQGLGLDGVNDTVSVVNSSSIQSMASAGTINYWVKLNGTPNHDDTMIDVSNTGAGGLVLLFDSTDAIVTLLYADAVDLSYAYSTTDLQSGRWYMVTATWNSGGVKLYINGTAEGSNTTAPAITPAGHTTYFGSNVGAVRFLNGTLDDIRFYNRVLSQEEITNLYKLGD